MSPAFDGNSLSALFAPRSIAVVGASHDKTKIGGRPLDFLMRFGFNGDIYAVNPRSAEVQGLKTLPSLAAIGKPVDLAILAIPAASVIAAIEDAAKAGVKGLVVFSSGFAEVDAAGRQAQDDMRRIAHAAGMRILGPNCLGFANVASHVLASFSPVIGIGQAKPGRTAIVSQSGAFGAYAYSLARERGLGLSHWIATGNEADVDVADCIGWLAAADDTDVILAYIEGAKDGRKLMSALDLARAAGKPVVVVKVGRTSVGAEAAASHTAALAGEDAVYDSIFRQCGAFRARTIEEFFDVGYAASRCGLPRSNRIGIVTVSGGVGVLMADDAVENGLDVAEMPADAQARVKALVPFAAPRNPLDTTGQVSSDITLLDQSVEIMLATGQYDLLATFQSAAGLSPEFGPHMADLAGHVRARYPDVAVACCALLRPEVRVAIEATGALAFEDPSRMIRTLGGLAKLAAGQKAVPLTPMPSSTINMIPGSLNEAEALKVLQRAGVPVVPSRVCRSSAEAVAAATAFGFPVAAKIASRDIVHKSDIGGVKLGLVTGAAVATAFDGIMTNAAHQAPHAAIDGILIAPMVSDGVECFIGVQRDAAFGPVVVFGLGGVLVEVLKDVAFRAAPFGIDTAHAMIREIKGRAILDGVRGKPAADIEALADALVAVSQFAAAAGDTLETLDINPFVVRARGQGAMALDAVLVGRPASS